MPKKGQNYCLNCDTSFVDGSEYCHSCGQTKRASILSFKELWSNFWTTIFNVDNSFFTTLRLIGRPDKLTQLYVSGKRKKHINPVRLFLISLVFFVAAVISTIGDFGDNNFLKNMNRDYYSSLLLERYDDLVGEMEIDEAAYEDYEALKQEVFEGVVCSEVDTMFDGMRIVDFGQFRSITKKDFVELTEEEVYEKYDAQTYFEKLNYRQYIRINKDPNASNKFLFNNALWGLIPCILILCLFLKLLYRNHEIPYLEHLVFVSNTHSFLFLFWMIVSLFIHWFVDDLSLVSRIIPFAILGSLSFVFVMLYMYYKEGFFRSLLKYVLCLFVYAIFGMFFIVVFMIISGFIF